MAPYGIPTKTSNLCDAGGRPRNSWGYFCVGLLALAMRPPSQATTREIAPAWVARRKESPAKAALSLGRNRTVPHSCRPCGPSDETVTNTDVVCAM